MDPIRNVTLPVSQTTEPRPTDSDHISIRQVTPSVNCSTVHEARARANTPVCVDGFGSKLPLSIRFAKCKSSQDLLELHSW